jgi:hypothetical protein
VDDYGDDLIEEIMGAETNSYVNEYNDIIAQISYVCQSISKNSKSFTG